MNEAYIHPGTQNAQARRQPAGTLCPSSDLVQYVRQYARERPEVAALWCFGIGFVLGWKLKIW